MSEADFHPDNKRWKSDGDENKEMSEIKESEVQSFSIFSQSLGRGTSKNNVIQSSIARKNSFSLKNEFCENDYFSFAIDASIDSIT